MKTEPRRFTLEPGVADMLTATSAAMLGDHVKLWNDEIAKREIGEETRAVLVALRWITQGDVRVHAIPASESAVRHLSAILPAKVPHA